MVKYEEQAVRDDSEKGTRRRRRKREKHISVRKKAGNIMMKGQGEGEGRGKWNKDIIKSGVKQVRCD